MTLGEAYEFYNNHNIGLVFHNGVFTMEQWIYRDLLTFNDDIC